MFARARRRRQITKRLKALDRLDARSDLVDRSRRLGHEQARGALILMAAVAAFAGLVLVIAAGPASLASRIGIGPHPLGHPPPAPHSTSYRFMHTQADGSTPVTWDPCRRIRYAINPDGGPADGVVLVRSAVQDVSYLTGLSFGYVGTTADRPRSDGSAALVGDHRGYDVLISWATANQVPRLAGDVAGIGGPEVQAPTNGIARYVAGQATLDADAFAAMSQRAQGTQIEQAVILHELGHVVGLAHVPDPTQLMYKDNTGLLEFGPGDRAGLARLGTGRCT